MTPEQRQARSRLAAYVQWSRTPDRTARTQTARDAFWQRFLDQVDPEQRLPEEQRVKMAQAARRAHFTRLSMKSAKARAAKKAGGAP
jgi:hypothetical protein